MDKTHIQDMGQGMLRLRAANPGPLTGSGTNSYLVFGPSGALIIDPGPALAAHYQAIMSALAGTRLHGILISHPHLDHSALAPRLAAQTEAKIFSFGPVQPRQANIGGGEGVDVAHVPDVRLHEGQVLELAGLPIISRHTPGHMHEHLCFGIKDILFTADHIMAWSTSLVSPPDGNMTDYLRSLRALLNQGWKRFLPGHGDSVHNPDGRIKWLLDHRFARQKAILETLSNRPQTARDIAEKVYVDIDPSLLPAATRNVLAHLIDMQAQHLARSTLPIRENSHFYAV